jgi:hypothetical protein
MSRFLLGEVGDDERDESLVDDCLNLGLVSGRDVGEEPDCFLQTEIQLLNAIFSRGFFCQSPYLSTSYREKTMSILGV